MNRRRAAALLPLVFGGGCVYLNVLYNARETFDEAERIRWSGQGAEASVHYDSVIAKAARGYRREPEGPWADDALYLLGRAYLRKGELAKARGALGRVLAMSDDRNVREGARLHLGMVMASIGEYGVAAEHLNEALRNVDSRRLLGEGHLWRARVLLRTGQEDAGWWDLDRAVEAHDRYEIPAGLERITWGLRNADTTRVSQGVRVLLGNDQGFLREDTLRSLVRAAAQQWGPAGAAGVLGTVERSRWPRDVQERFVLDRARLRLSAGDTVLGILDANSVSDGSGPEAVTARLLVAGVELGGVRAVAELSAVRALLLPAVGDSEVLSLLESVRVVELLASDGGRGQDSAEALFAAAELARDRLGAPRLARALFLEYGATGSVWAGKAALAALALSRSEVDRRDPLAQVARLRNDPYVMAADPARSGPVDLVALDADLQGRLTPLLDEAMVQATQLDVLIRERSDTIGGGS